MGAVLSVPAGTLVAVATDIPLEVRDLAVAQCGVLSRAQIQSAGLSRYIVRSRLRRGSWRRVYPGVYSTSSGELRRESAMWAAVLSAGPGAMLSHQTAAELWRLSDEPSSLIHVTVPGERRVIRRPGILLHISARASLAVHPAASPPRSRVEETVLDLWETARTIDEAVGWITRAIGRRRTTADRLRAAADSRNKVRWRSELTELLDEDGIHSVLEFRYVRDVERAHGLPTATRQLRSRADGRSLYRDEVYEDYQTVVELDGRLAHPGDTRWGDIRRDNAAATAGLVTLRYGWAPVRRTPCQVAAEVEEVLVLHGFPGGRPCSAACQVGRRSA